jgi:uncharacterized membrane protein YqiK
MSFLTQFKNAGAVEKALTEGGYQYTAESILALLADAKIGRDAKPVLESALAEIEAERAKADAEISKAKADAAAEIEKAKAELAEKASIKAQELLSAQGFKGTVPAEPASSAKGATTSNLTGIERAIAAHRDSYSRK